MRRRTPRLRLPRPERWPIEGVKLRTEPLRALPADLDAFAGKCLGRGISEGKRVLLREPRHGLSELGWPLLVREADVVDTAGQVEQRRLLFVYRFLDWIGVVRIIVTDVAAWEREQASLMQSLGAAQPDFSDGAATSLWEALSVDPG